MIDLHCHLLPGIDDGPDSMDAALALARQAVADGVTRSIVTPHIHHGRWENDRQIITRTLTAFQQALASAGIPLETGMAAEVRIGAEVLLMVEQGEVPFLGEWHGERVMLLELPHSHVPPGTDRMIEWLLDRGVLPMIAHPERNKDVMRKFSKLDPFIELGCLFQVTAGSVAGQFGPHAMRCAHQLLAQGQVTVLASDAHSVKNRPVNLSAGRAAAAQIIGVEAAAALVTTHPAQLLGLIDIEPTTCSGAC